MQGHRIDNGFDMIKLLPQLGIEPTSYRQDGYLC